MDTLIKEDKIKMIKIHIFLILITLIIPMTAESKDMKIIYFNDDLGSEINGKIIYNDQVKTLKGIWPVFNHVTDDIDWHYLHPIFLGKNYIAIKCYRNSSKRPYYYEYSLLILDENFKLKEELLKVRNKVIFYTAFNPLKQVIAFSLAEKDKNDQWITKRSFLILYDLGKKKVIFSKEMGQNLYFTTRAFNSNGELICLVKGITETETKGDVTRYREKDHKIILYDIKKDKEYFINKGVNASFVNDNLIAYINNGSLYFYDLTTKKSEKYFSSKLLKTIFNYFISPDNKQIIIVYENKFTFAKQLILYDFETKEEVKWDLLKEIDSALHIDWQFAE